jgi:beta-xylosidase
MEPIVLIGRFLLKKATFLTALFLYTALSASAQSPSFKTYMNPVIPGDHPDPGLIRVGNDYFTTGSAFNPSAVIYHSTDLVHWEVSSHPVDPGWTELGDCPACGMWGGSMAYFAGSYWDYFGLNGAMWFVKSDSPFGPWGTPVRMQIPASAANGLGIDNSIFVDEDGTAYLVAKPGQDKNQIFKLNSQGQCTGEKIDFGWMNPAPAYPLSWAEGPVMCKRNGWYYYFVAGNAAGGEYAFRSKTLTGDKTAWESFGDIFSTADHSNSLFYGPNHCSTPVQLPDSTWWSIVHSWAFTWTNDEWQGLGRQGLLCQVTWNASGRPTMQWPVNESLPAPKLSSSGIPWMVPKSDFFDSGKLNAEWEFFGRTPAEMYSVSDRPGWLRLKPGATMKHILKNDAEHAYSLMCRLDFDATAADEEAGIRISNGLVNEKNLDARLFSSFNAGIKVVAFTFNKARFETPNIIGNVLWLKLVRTSHMLTAFFSSNGEIWTQVGLPFDVSAMDKNQPDTNGWIGNRQGLYAQNKAADFDFYIYRDAYTPIMAEYPANQWGTKSVKSSDGMLDLDNIHNQDWALYAGVEFGNDQYKKTAVQFDINASSATDGGIVEIWLDSIQTGSKIGECTIVNTGDWTSLKNFSTKIKPVTGRHDLYLYFTGSVAGKLFNIRSFSFVSKAVSEFRSSKVDGDPNTVMLKLSVPVVLPETVTGFGISINGLPYAGSMAFSVSNTDSCVVLIKSARELEKSDEITISYENGNLLTADSADLISFFNKPVENLLPGSAPHILSAQTTPDGSAIELLFNKSMSVPPDSVFFSLSADSMGKIKPIDVANIDSKPGNPFTIVIAPEEKIYAEYCVLVNYKGDSLKSTDNGILAPFFSFPVKNLSIGLPPVIVSGLVNNDGLSFALVFTKTLMPASGQSGNFAVRINNEICLIESITTERFSLLFKMKNPLRFADEISVSYSGNTFGSTDSAILGSFLDYPVTNILPEPVFLPIPGIIEAENFVTNSGTQTENTTDNGGGLYVGWIETNDYTDFAVDVKTAGLYTVIARIASPNSGTRVLLLKPGLTALNLDTIPIPNTGNWQTWKNVYSLVSLDTGRQYLRKFASNGGYNINWFRFEEGNTMPAPLILDISTDATGKKIEIAFDKDMGSTNKAISYFKVTVDGKEASMYSVTLKPRFDSILLITLSVPVTPSNTSVLISYTGSVLKAFDNTPVSDFEGLSVRNITSVNTLQTDRGKVRIYPNPSKNEICIESEFRYNHIEILDLSGKSVFSKLVNVYDPLLKIEVGLDEGAYFITLLNQSEKIVRKVMIE